LTHRPVVEAFLNENGRSSGGFLNRLQSWLSRQLVQDVPDEVSVCEYECNRTDCRIGQWNTCEKRLYPVSDPGLKGS
jgi:hypothetical protein